MSELLCTDQGITPSGKDVEHFQTDVFQEFKALLEDKFTDKPCLAFYSQNLFDYEQGVAPAIVKGRLKAHFQFWLDIGAPLCNLRWCDIVFKDTYFSLFFPRSKSDQYGSGATRVVAGTGNPTCPFDMFRRYATLSGDNISSAQFVLRSLYKSKAGGYFLWDGSKLSYSRARELFIQKFRAIGLDTNLYGLLPFASEEPLPLRTVTFPIVLLKSTVVGSPTRPRIPSAERTFNTNSWSL